MLQQTNEYLVLLNEYLVLPNEYLVKLVFKCGVSFDSTITVKRDPCKTS